MENQSNGLIGVGWALRWRIGRRRGSVQRKTKAMVWVEVLGWRRGSTEHDLGLGEHFWWRTGRRRGSKTWVDGLGLGSAWVDDVEAGEGIGRRCWDREVRVIEREREARSNWERERMTFYYFNQPARIK